MAAIIKCISRNGGFGAAAFGSLDSAKKEKSAVDGVTVDEAICYPSTLKSLFDESSLSLQVCPQSRVH